MPYIKAEERRAFWKKDFPIKTPGALNYLFTRLASAYLGYNGESYQHYNDIIGALEGAKLELYRRKVAWYEDKKIAENGDVY